MSDDSLSGKRMDEMDELVRQHDAEVFAANARRSAQRPPTPKMPDIMINAETVRDAHHKQGNPAAFKLHIGALIDAGNSVSVVEQGVQLIFESSTDFSDWFDGAGKPNN